jgi:hypothetical protein
VASRPSTNESTSFGYERSVCSISAREVATAGSYAVSEFRKTSGDQRGPERARGAERAHAGAGREEQHAGETRRGGEEEERAKRPFRPEGRHEEEPRREAPRHRSGGVHEIRGTHAAAETPQVVREEPEEERDRQARERGEREEEDERKEALREEDLPEAEARDLTQVEDGARNARHREERSRARGRHGDRDPGIVQRAGAAREPALEERAEAEAQEEDRERQRERVRGDAEDEPQDAREDDLHPEGRRARHEEPRERVANERRVGGVGRGCGGLDLGAAGVLSRERQRARADEDVHERRAERRPEDSRGLEEEEARREAPDERAEEVEAVKEPDGAPRGLGARRHRAQKGRKRRAHERARRREDERGQDELQRDRGGGREGSADRPVERARELHERTYGERVEPDPDLELAVERERRRDAVRAPPEPERPEAEPRHERGEDHAHCLRR